VSRFITENFVPVKVHIKEQGATFHRFDVNWTPTLLVIDPKGPERYRFEGWMPKDEFLGQLMLGLARFHFMNKRWGDAEKLYEQIVKAYPKTEAAEEALYWQGVSRYKASGDHTALGATAQQYNERYPNTLWAKKASVWAA